MTMRRSLLCVTYEHNISCDAHRLTLSDGERLLPSDVLSTLVHDNDTLMLQRDTTAAVPAAPVPALISSSSSETKSMPSFSSSSGTHAMAAAVVAAPIAAFGMKIYVKMATSNELMVFYISDGHTLSIERMKQLIDERMDHAVDQQTLIFSGAELPKYAHVHVSNAYLSYDHDVAV